MTYKKKLYSGVVSTFLLIVALFIFAQPTAASAAFYNNQNLNSAQVKQRFDKINQEYRPYTQFSAADKEFIEMYGKKPKNGKMRTFQQKLGGIPTIFDFINPTFVNFGGFFNTRAKESGYTSFTFSQFGGELRSTATATMLFNQRVPLELQSRVIGYGPVNGQSGSMGIVFYRSWSAHQNGNVTLTTGVPFSELTNMYTNSRLQLLATDGATQYPLVTADLY